MGSALAFAQETERMPYPHEVARAEEVREGSRMRCGLLRADVDAEIAGRARLQDAPRPRPTMFTIG